MAWLIVLAVLLGLLALFIIYDQRKKIFKKREKKQKKPKKIKQEKIENKIENPKVSFDRKEIKILEEERKNAKVEDAEIEGLNQKIEYNTTMPTFGGRRRRMPPRNADMFSDFNRNSRSYSENKSIREQIDELSPEMKAILLANVLGRKDD